VARHPDRDAANLVLFETSSTAGNVAAGAGARRNDGPSAAESSRKSGCSWERAPSREEGTV